MGPFDPAEQDLEQNIDPSLGHLQADEPASPEEERALADGILQIRDFLGSEQGLANVVQVLEQDNRELFAVVPDIAAPILQRVRTDNPNAPVSIFFGEGGLLEQVTSEIWEIAEQREIPGSSDQDQFAGAVMNLYTKVGQHILDNKDTAAIREAQQLGINMATTGEDGEQIDPDKMISKTPLAQAVRDELGVTA